MDTPSSGDAAPTRSRGRNFLLGCLAGCGALALLAVSSCLGLVWWINRPGELLEPARLRGPETTAYVEWTLRLEDPGTSAFVTELLASMNRLQRSASPLPGALGGILANYQERRNEKQMRELFPCVVAWGVFAAAKPDEELHLVTLSVEKLGNRLVVMDWILGWILGRDSETEVVSHGGEKIYVLKKLGSAFFLRRSQIFFTTGLEAATRAVDRLQPGAAGPAEATELDRLIDGLPADRPLRGATTNRHGEVRRLVALLLEPQAEEPPGEVWDQVRAATLAGGFAQDSTFHAALDLRTEGPVWSDENARAIAASLAASLSTGTLPVRVEAVPHEDGVRFDFEVDDLPRLLERWTERVVERARSEHNRRRRPAE